MNDKPELLDIIDVLTLEHPYKATIEGKSRWVRRDPLIKTLRELIASSMTGGNSTPANVSRLPFDADALRLYADLESLVLEKHAIVGRVPGLTPEENLRAWYVAFKATNPEDDAAELTLWSGWVSKIEAKIGSPVVLELMTERVETILVDGKPKPITRHDPVPCPDCGFGWFTTVLNSGPGWVDSEQRVALTATYRPDGEGGLQSSSVECGCCHWRISGSTKIREFSWALEKSAA